MNSIAPIAATPAAPQRVAIRGDLLDFTAAPAWGEVDSDAVRFRPDHWLLIEDGSIQAVQPAERPLPPQWQAAEQHDHRGRLLHAGLHRYPCAQPAARCHRQLRQRTARLAGDLHLPGRTPLCRPRSGRIGAALFCDSLLAAGTTSAVVFPTVHKGSVDALFGAAAHRGMRLIAGKVLMDRHAPDGLRDDVAQAERDCIDLIDRWHGRQRLSYAVTVRFAPTSTPAQLAMAGALCKADPSLYMQTHVAENRAEVKWVAELFPQARSYLDVYASAGLLHPRSVLAHGIWLDDPDRADVARNAARRSPTARRRTCSSAAACSTGAPPKRPVPRSASPPMSAAAPACRCCERWATPTRCRPCAAND